MNEVANRELSQALTKFRTVVTQRLANRRRGLWHVFSKSPSGKPPSQEPPSPNKFSPTKVDIVDTRKELEASVSPLAEPPLKRPIREIFLSLAWRPFVLVFLKLFGR